MVFRGNFVSGKRTASGKVVWNLYGEGSKVQRITVQLASKIELEKTEIRELYQQWNAKSTEGEYKAVFQLTKGTAEAYFTDIDTAVDCCKYIAKHAEVWDKFVFVWYHGKWVYRLWESQNSEELRAA